MFSVVSYYPDFLILTEENEVQFRRLCNLKFAIAICKAVAQ